VIMAAASKIEGTRQSIESVYSTPKMTIVRVVPRTTVMLLSRSPHVQLGRNPRSSQ
jgi:hypothetical protein